MIGDALATSGAVQKNGGKTSVATTVNVKPCKSPGAAPVTIVPAVTSQPLSRPSKSLLVFPAPS